VYLHGIKQIYFGKHPLSQKREKDDGKREHWQTLSGSRRRHATDAA
jgi:hypothetical protein